MSRLRKRMGWGKVVGKSVVAGVALGLGNQDVCVCAGGAGKVGCVAGS